MATDLTNVDDLKAWLGNPGSSDDDLLAALVSNVSAEILNQLNRPAILSASYSEIYNGNDGVRLALKNFPVTAIATLVVDVTTVPASPDGVQTGYVFDQYGVKLVGSYTFTRGFANVRITYTAGYAVVPVDLAQAAKEICALRYMARKRIGLRTQASKAGETTTFDMAAMPAFAKAVIDQYRRRVPV